VPHNPGLRDTIPSGLAGVTEAADPPSFTSVLMATNTNWIKLKPKISMKRNVLFGSIALLAGSLIAADSTPKEDIKAAAKKLAEKSNYSWKQTVDSAGGQFRPGPTEGKTEKDGFTVLSMTFGENTRQAVLKGSKGALETDDGWQSLAEAAEAEGRGRFRARMLQNFKAPAAQAEDLAAKAKELKKSEDAYAGDLTEAGVKELLTFGGRGGGGGAAPSNAKGSVKFWVKDGVLSKYQYKVQGTVTFGGNDVDIDRTTTVEIKDIGTTKVNAPEAAKKKLS
jgi:hypothetical protein